VPGEIRRNEWAAGWRTLVAAFFATGVGWNFASVSSALFLKPMQAEFGWTRTELSYGPLAGLLVALSLPITGLLLDRFGSRRVAITGLMAIACAYALFACTPVNHALFDGCMICLGLAGAISNSVVMARGVAPWFNRNLGAAIGTMMVGTSLFAAIAVPLLSRVIERYGWRSGFWALVAATVTVGLPLALLWFREPASSGPRERAGEDSFRAISGTVQFWQLIIACSIAALPIGGFISHLIPLLSDLGLPIRTAAWLGSVFAVSVGIGRVATGAALDRLYPPLVIGVTLALAACGALLLYLTGSSTTTRWAFVGPIALLGLAQGAEGDYIIFFSMRLFGIRNLSRVVSILAMVIGLGMALGGLAFAKVFDLWGSYRFAVLGSVALYAIGAIIFGTVSMKPALNEIDPAG
jgi:predicted MFS family arabinose efflux permease